MGWASEALHDDIMRAGIASGMFRSGSLSVYGGSSSSSSSSYSRCSSKKKSKLDSLEGELKVKLVTLTESCSISEELEDRWKVYIDVMTSYLASKNSNSTKHLNITDRVRNKMENIVNWSVRKDLVSEDSKITDQQLSAIRCIHYWTNFQPSLNKYDYNCYLLKSDYLRYAMPIAHMIKDNEDNEGSWEDLDYPTYLEYLNNNYNLI